MLYAGSQFCWLVDSKNTLRSGNGTAGRATSDVSSRKIRVSLKGMAYRNVGNFRFLACQQDGAMLRTGSKTWLP